MMTSNTTSSNICQYCNNTYQDPRILSCLHSYCVQCITKLYIEDTTSIICPTCNHSTILPDGSVTSLPRNIRLNQETKQDTVLAKVTSTSPLPCDSCDETSIAYCTECDDLLCNIYHNNQNLDLYCQQCTIPVCVTCSGIYHKDHPVHHMSQQIIQNKEEYNRI